MATFGVRTGCTECSRCTEGRPTHHVESVHINPYTTKPTTKKYTDSITRPETESPHKNRDYKKKLPGRMLWEMQVATRPS